MSEADLAWAAGFFDGEGSISIYAQKAKPGYHPVIVLACKVGQVDKEPLLRLASLFGGCINHHAPATARTKASYQWQVTTRIASSFLSLIRPFIVRPRVLARLDLAQAFQAQKVRGGRRPRPETYHEKQLWFYERMKELNEKGPRRREAMPKAA